MASLLLSKLSRAYLASIISITSLSRSFFIFFKFLFPVLTLLEMSILILYTVGHAFYSCLPYCDTDASLTSNSDFFLSSRGYITLQTLSDLYSRTNGAKLGMRSEQQDFQHRQMSSVMGVAHIIVLIICNSEEWQQCLQLVILGFASLSQTVHPFSNTALFQISWSWCLQQSQRCRVDPRWTGFRIVTGLNR